MFSLMPTAISCHSADPTAAPGAEQPSRAVSSRGGWCRARSHSDQPEEVWKVGQETEGCFGKRVLEGIYNLEHNQDFHTVCFDKTTLGHKAECKGTETLVAHYESTNLKTWMNSQLRLHGGVCVSRTLNFGERLKP